MLRASLLVVLTLLLLTPPLGAQFACLPSCSAIDARYLTVLGPTLGGSAGWQITGTVALPSTATAVQLGVFDGDSSGQWDFSGAAPALVFELYEDPTATGIGTVRVGQWLGSSLADNAWSDLTLAVGSGAQSLSGAYFYKLVIRATTTVPDLAFSSFKLRVPDDHELLLSAQQRLIFSGRVFTVADRAIVYPNYPAATGSSFDGEWTFHLLVTAEPATLEIWDGDFDYGSADCVDNDTDDANSPPEAPPWHPAAAPEGVATGEMRACGTTTGANADDSDYVYFQRSPSIHYTLEVPGGPVYQNLNPSGNSEWERFSLATGSSAEADVDDVLLAAGIYRLRVLGGDLSNAFSWYLPGPLVAPCDASGATLCSPHFVPEPAGARRADSRNGQAGATNRVDQ